MIFQSVCAHTPSACAILSVGYTTTSRAGLPACDAGLRARDAGRTARLRLKSLRRREHVPGGFPVQNMKFSSF